MNRVRTFVGLDIHRAVVVGTAIDTKGRQVRQASFGSTPKELVRFLGRLPKPTKVVIESCSVWERYYEAARSTGADVVVSHPRTTRMIAEASLKTDKVDSATLANLLRLDSVPLVYIQNPELRELRKLYLDRRFYTRTKTTISQHAYARLGQHGVDYKRNAMQRKTRRDKFRPLGIPEVNIALDALDDFETRCKELDARIHTAFLKSEDAQLLRTIPGVGEADAVGLVGYIGPVERFRSSEKLTSYAGLCPTTHQSSDTSFHGHLKPDCSRGLRGLLIEASWRHRIHAPRGDVARCAQRIARSKGRMHGSIAGAHKLLRIIYAMLKQRRPYRPHAPERSVSLQHLRESLSRPAPISGVRRTPQGHPLHPVGGPSRTKRARARATAKSQSAGKFQDSRFGGSSHSKSLRAPQTRVAATNGVRVSRGSSNQQGRSKQRGVSVPRKRRGRQKAQRTPDESRRE
jgi:transposase